MTGKVNEATLEALVAGCKTPQDVAALYQQMLQRVIDRSLSAELDAHLGYERHEKPLDYHLGHHLRMHHGKSCWLRIRVSFDSY